MQPEDMPPPPDDALREKLAAKGIKLGGVIGLAPRARRGVRRGDVGEHAPVAGRDRRVPLRRLPSLRSPHRKLASGAPLGDVQGDPYDPGAALLLRERVRV